MLKNVKNNRHGFTLVEVLIVVVILGILAATVLPQMTASSADAKESALVQDLQMLRSQIQLYKFQHDGELPGAGTATFEDQMLKSTDLVGVVGDIGTKPYGPYIIGSVPQNPYNGKNGFAIVTGPVSGTTAGASNVDANGNEAGWIYSKDTGEIKANSLGTAADGTALEQL